MKKNLHSIIVALIFGTATINAQYIKQQTNTTDGPKNHCASVAPDLKWENQFQELEER